MRFIISILLVLALLFSFSSCTQTYSKIEDYHMIYDNVYEANKTFTKSGQKETLLGWGEYTYCSYMLLFPREAPDNLLEFDYYWFQSMDYDDYGICFSYKLNEEDYKTFKEKLSEFSITYNEQVNKPIFLQDIFEYPAYILSWSQNVQDSGFCEYIMLDDNNCTVINVYQIFYGLNKLQTKTDSHILPKNMTCDEIFHTMPYTIRFAKNSGYCVYAFYDEENKLCIPDLEELTYDTSFLEIS